MWASASARFISEFLGGQLGRCREAWSWSSAIQEVESVVGGRKRWVEISARAVAVDVERAEIVYCGMVQALLDRRPGR